MGIASLGSRCFARRGGPPRGSRWARDRPGRSEGRGFALADFNGLETTQMLAGALARG